MVGKENGPDSIEPISSETPEATFDKMVDVFHSLDYSNPEAGPPLEMPFTLNEPQIGPPVEE